MAYQFVTRCANCAKEFGITWVMDSTRVGAESLARITCPHCKQRFSQHAKDLLPIGPQILNLKVSRPVRSVEVSFDCPHCHEPGILESLLHTDLSWDELVNEHVRTTVCNNGLSPQRGVTSRTEA